jgi:hypothetical protein
MGIKPSNNTDNGTQSLINSSNNNSSSDKIQKMQKETFDHLDREYEMARMTTHTHRGMGLGFATSSSTTSHLIDPNIKR